MYIFYSKPSEGLRVYCFLTYRCCNETCVTVRTTLVDVKFVLRYRIIIIKKQTDCYHPGDLPEDFFSQNAGNTQVHSANVSKLQIPNTTKIELSNNIWVLLFFLIEHSVTKNRN